MDEYTGLDTKDIFLLPHQEAVYKQMCGRVLRPAPEKKVNNDFDGKVIVLDGNTAVEYDHLTSDQQEKVRKLKAIADLEREESMKRGAALSALSALASAGIPEYIRDFAMNNDPLPNAPRSERGRMVTPPERVRAGQRRNAPCTCGSGKKFKVCCLRASVEKPAG